MEDYRIILKYFTNQMTLNHFLSKEIKEENDKIIMSMEMF
jgi:hypothetical protein